MLKRSILTCLFLALSVTGHAALASGTHDSHHEEMAYGMPGNAKMVSRTVTITATEIAFEPQALDVKKDETVRFLLVNKGEQPHEFTIGDAATQIEHRKMMQDMAGMSMAEMGHDEPNMVSAEPGETKELVWTFTKAGRFEFACNYPGHAEIGMKGPLIVH